MRNPFFPSLLDPVMKCVVFPSFQELSSITMPVEFNEPLSFLQRISEYMEYSYLLKTAAGCDDPLQRLQVR
ncbi:hypothetical protein CDAR_280951 [Caerostris darwini]|uniref:Uncharacterized protein n=1 Tax=Caerostris darwini TaxID=1538125 RepID=A0AAV4VC49_9ARAC|nr:hypothetical protein CDAR_280951 [Caerostris darwini]